MKNRIYLFGTFGDLDGLPMGGGHMSARRIWHNLERLGYDVRIHNRIRVYGPRTFINKFKSAIGMIVDALLWSGKLLFMPRESSIAIVIGYGGIMSLLDCSILLIARKLGFKIVYYLKGGGTESMFDEGSKSNRKFFENALQNSNLVLTEGEANVDFVHRITNYKVKVCYMPNYIEEEFLPTDYPEKPANELNILYFGRIDESKNVKLIVEIFNLVAAKYNNATLTIVGKLGTKYANEVDSMIVASPFCNRITRIGHSSHDDLAKIMQNQHLFLFPSNEDREGHSNSLNEAMAWGLVPIVSENNFLPSIVGDSELVIRGFDTGAYMEKISYLIDNNLIRQKSKQVYQRVTDNFTQEIVEKKLGKILEDIFNTNVI